MTVPNHLDSSYYGFEVPLKHDMEYFKVRKIIIGKIRKTS